MATTTAKLVLSSTDLLTDELSLTSEATLTGAGGTTGLTQTTGLARNNTSAANAGAIQASVLFRAEDYATNGANKVYIKNCSADPVQFYTVHIDQEEIGRLYAGDWLFMPWNATSGTRASFTVTVTGDWVANDTWEFDGVTATAGSATEAEFAAIVDGTNYPNWTTDYATGEVAITFHQRWSGGLTNSVAVTADGTSNTTGTGTMPITLAAVGKKSESDITIRPSVHASMVVEYMLLHE